MNYNIFAYLVYIVITIGLIIWIAKTLYKNTQSFLLLAYKDNTALATATNNLVQTGFYLIALGYSFMHMSIRKSSYMLDGKKYYDQLNSVQQTIEELAIKLGSFTLVMGVLLFINFFAMMMISRSKQNNTLAK